MANEAVDIMDQAVKAMANREGKYLIFSLASEEYGISILKVKEIIGMITITPVPKTPEHVKRVINLCGKVMPVIDLRLKFGIETVAYTERTCIVVVEIAMDHKKLHGNHCGFRIGSPQYQRRRNRRYAELRC